MILVQTENGTIIPYGPANPQAVVALCVIGAVLTVVALFKGYLDMVGQAGSVLIAVLNFLVIPYLLVRMGMHAYRRRWKRMLVCLAIIPAIGFFTHSEAQMMPHAKRYFFATQTNDVELARIKYSAPASWQLQLTGSPERVMHYARALGTFGLTLASMDANLYRYMGVAAFQQRCVGSSPITQEDDKTAPALTRMFSRAGLGYPINETTKALCGSEQAIQANYGISLKEMLATELADNRAALAKIEALGNKFGETCNNNSRDTSCSVIGLALINTTSDGGSVLRCSDPAGRPDCVRISLPNPHGPTDRAAWGNAPMSQRSYDDWKQSLALLRDSKAEGCYGNLCRATYEYRK